MKDQREHNLLFTASRLRTRLSHAVRVSRKKSQELSTTKAQLLLYARDLKQAYERESRKARELEASQAQTLKFVADLRKTVRLTRQQARELEEAYQAGIIALSRAIEARDRYTAFHTDRVTAYAVETARQLGWNRDRMKILKLGGHLHDLGKVGIADAILNKPGRLTPEEFQEMRSHPQRGAEIVEGLTYLKPMLPYILYHHERYDGTGYPTGLKGADIPEEGRLLAVADTFDAMTSTRPYRQALPVERALNELRTGGGTQFDPTFVEAFLAAWNSGRLERILALGQDGRRAGMSAKDDV